MNSLMEKLNQLKYLFCPKMFPVFTNFALILKKPFSFMHFYDLYQYVFSDRSARFIVAYEPYMTTCWP